MNETRPRDLDLALFKLTKQTFQTNDEVHRPTIYRQLTVGLRWKVLIVGQLALSRRDCRDFHSSVLILTLNNVEGTRARQFDLQMSKVKFISVFDDFH